MNRSPALSRRFVRVGGLAGLLSVGGYLLVVIGPFLPRWLRDGLGIAIGPLAIVGLMGLYTAMAVHRETLAAWLGTLFGIIGGVIMNVYTVIQKANWRWHAAALDAAEGEAAVESAHATFYAVDRVQGAMDISFDIFLLVGIVLLAAAMFRHPKFGPWLGGIGVLLATTTLVLNLWTFPTPPDQAGLVDAGPLVGLWLLLVFARTLALAAWAGEEGRGVPGSASIQP